MAEPTTCASWTQCNELWFEDGNIILVAEGVGYRVHRSMLCIHSEIFNDIFGVADPASSDIFDGCPVIALPDTREDIYNMLKAIHFRQVESKPSFSLIVSLLRVATKYMINDLRTEIIGILCAIFPTTLEAYEASSKTYCPEDVAPIVVVHLGMAYNVPTIIPAACYLVALMDPNESILDEGDISSVIWSMRMRSRDQLMEVIEVSVRRSYQLTAFPTAANPTTCQPPPFAWRSLDCSRQDCNGISDNRKYRLERTCRRLSCDILKRRKPMVSMGHACDACEACLADYWAEIRRRIWEFLPELCGYTDWQSVHLKAAQLT
ncbi:hypothetical protein EWM64_g10740 [Hericium alpestre]|uniref:BTB domain-containing protein n=1 Tax=Hericium alpestre TaxID=135208 RepID=A0A4Y9ZFA5_9AGAM|nr:hypothetical protein EWM64_g10740 [Hericium alpestre]